jgi:hypothetical protein
MIILLDKAKDKSPNLIVLFSILRGPTWACQRCKMGIRCDDHNMDSCCIMTPGTKREEKSSITEREKDNRDVAASLSPPYSCGLFPCSSLIRTHCNNREAIQCNAENRTAVRQERPAPYNELRMLYSSPRQCHQYKVVEWAMQVHIDL